MEIVDMDTILDRLKPNRRSRQTRGQLDATPAIQMVSRR